jgi:hypothetical protein
MNTKNLTDWIMNDYEHTNARLDQLTERVDKIIDAMKSEYVNIHQHIQAIRDYIINLETQMRRRK